MGSRTLPDPATLAGAMVADAMISCATRHDITATVGDVRRYLEDDHVHMALIVDHGQRLVTTIERSDLEVQVAADVLAKTVGTLSRRTIRPDASLAPVAADMLTARRRRLAVVDDADRLLGLLCLKRSGTGFCTDDGVRARALERLALADCHWLPIR